MTEDSELNQWNNNWEEIQDEEFTKKIRLEIEKYKEKSNSK
jgi:hypothetical protein